MADAPGWGMDAARPEDEDALRAPLRYEDHADFNARFDEQHAVNIPGLAVPASLVLFRFDEIAYREAVLDYRNQQQTYFRDRVLLDQFPSPIAIYVDRYLNACKNARERLRVLKDAWEAYIVVLYALVVSEFRHHCMSFSDAKVKYSEIYSDRLAVRTETLEKLLRHCEKRRIALRCHRFVSAGLIEGIVSLNQARNGFSHTATESELQADRLLETLEPRFFELLRQSEGLADIRLVRYADEMKNDGALAFTCEVFRGARINRRYEDLRLTAAQFLLCAESVKNTQVLAHMGDTFLDVAPFVHFADYDDGHTTRLLLMKRKKTEGEIAGFEFETVGLSKLAWRSADDFEPSVNTLQALFRMT